jgi:hypothetical protein
MVEDYLLNPVVPNAASDAVRLMRPFMNQMFGNNNEVLKIKLYN